MEEKGRPTVTQGNTHKYEPKPINNSSPVVLIIIMFLMALPFIMLYFAAHFLPDASTDATATAVSTTPTYETHDHSNVKTITDFNWDDDAGTEYLVCSQLDDDPPGTIIVDYTNVVNQPNPFTQRCVAAIPELPARLRKFVEENDYHCILLYGETVASDSSYCSNVRLILYKSDMIVNGSSWIVGTSGYELSEGVVFDICTISNLNNPDIGYHCLHSCAISQDNGENHDFAYVEEHGLDENDHLDQWDLTSYTPTDTHTDQMLAKFAELQSVEP